ncbi:MAG: 2,3-dehydroadipyl-CoA hydratase [Alphaproteobacteria bacterium MarineAlpha2_Bin1]|nr:MAG: 2,3-dehydroadipyl-CoA hydratase [Alphaproteobacteria bacterium MarineAlpha2_Bin1]
MSNDKEILINHDVKGVLVVTLNRPKVKNAFSNSLLSSLKETFELAEKNKEIKCIITTGGSEVYAAGSDINQLKTRPTHGGAAEIRFSDWDYIEKFTKPVIASVNGYALGGGCELAMLSDIIIAGESAKFGLPEVRLGLFPGLGGTQRLIRSVGKSIAMKVILAAEFIDAQEALRNGLVAEITKDDKTLERSLEIAKKIASMPPLTIKIAKKVILQSFETSLTAGLNYERAANLSLYHTYDKSEGISAFLEKRKPKWKGE